MSLGKAIAEAIAGGIAGWATAETGRDFISPLLKGQQAAQDRKARKAEIKFKAEVDKQTALELAEKRGKIEADTAKAVAKIRGDQESATAKEIAGIRVDSAEKIARFEADIRAEEAEKGREFQREEGATQREFTLKRDERLQTAKSAEAELDRAHSAYLADQSAENAEALQNARFAHDKAMKELDVAAREKAVQQAQGFQREEADRAREFEAQRDYARETGDFSGLLGLLPQGSSLIEDLTNRVQVATKTVFDRDQRTIDQFNQNLAAKTQVARDLARTSPNDFLERLDVMIEGATTLQGNTSENLALDTNKALVAEQAAAYLQGLRTLEEGAKQASLSMAVEAGEYKALADEGTSTKTRRTVISQRYGKDSTQQQAYDVSNTIVGYLENFNYTSLSDIEDPAVREIVGMLQGEGDDASLASLAEQLGRDLGNAPALAEAIDNVQIGDVQNSLAALQRLEAKRDFSARVGEAATNAGAQLDIDLELPSTAFIMDENGAMTLTATGATELAAAFEGSTGAAENPTLSALRAVDQVAARAGWDEGTIASTKRAIAQDYEFIEDLALTYENPAEVIGGNISANFRVMSPQVAAEIREQTSGMGDVQARNWMQKQGYNPQQLELVREGGSVYGREIVRSVLPNSAAAGSLMEDIQDELTVAVAAGDEDRTTGLTQELELLQSVAADPAVTNMAEQTMFAATRAVAHGDLEGFYDRMTAKAPEGTGLSLTLEDGENAQRDEFIEYVNQGATEGAKVRRALEYMSGAGAFQLGVRQQATSAGQQQFNSYIAAYADDYGQRIDDVIASMDLGAEFVTYQPLLFGRADTVSSPSTNALMYLTSSAEEVDEFMQTDPQSALQQENRARQLR